MPIFLTARLGHLPSPPWAGDEVLTQNQRIAGPTTPSLDHEAGSEAPDLAPWRALLREVAP
jgi:hypothetical protein